MNKLLIVGTVAFDTIKTPFGKAERILGGSGTYIGICSSIFEIKNSIVSVVGGDFKEKNLTLLQNKNIDISGIEIVKNGKTFFRKKSKGKTFFGKKSYKIRQKEDIFS